MERDAEQRLIAGVQAGDRRSLEDLYDLHAPAMLGLAARILGDRRDAEDLVHDVFLEAWNKAASFSPERGSVRGWLLLRVRSRAIDRVRTRSVARRHAHAQQDAACEAWRVPLAADDPSAAPDRRRACAALASLPEPQRTVIELAYFEGLSCSEIAACCETPLGTVKSRLVAGMRQLRSAFDAQDGAA